MTEKNATPKTAAPKNSRVSDLKSLGAFAPVKPVHTLVKWENRGLDEDSGENLEDVIFDVYVRRQSIGSFHDLMDKEKIGDQVQAAKLISTSIFEDENGKRLAFTYDEAYNLVPGLALAILDAVHKVNYVGKKKS